MSPTIIKWLAGVGVLLAIISGVWFGVHEIRAAGEAQAAAEAKTKAAENRITVLQDTFAQAQASVDAWKAAAAYEAAEKARQAQLAAQREDERRAAQAAADEAMKKYQDEVNHEPASSCLRQPVPPAVDRLLSGQAGLPAAASH